MLFVKEVDFPVSATGGAESKGKFSGTIRYINDPDNAGHFDAYRNLVDALIKAHAELKAVDVLDPVGPAFTLYASPSAANPSSTETDTKTTDTQVKPDDNAPGNKDPKDPKVADAKISTETNSFEKDIKLLPPLVPSRPDLKSPINADSIAFNLVTTANDGQYHVGNEFINAGGRVVPIVKGVSQFSSAYLNAGQLYRVYAGQIELCVNTSILRNLHYSIPDLTGSDASDGSVSPSSTADAAPKPDKNELQVANAVKSAAVTSLYSSSLGSGSGNSSSSGGAGKGASGSGSGGSQSSSSSQALTAALQAGRISAVVGTEGSVPDELVLPPASEEGFQKESQGFVHIQWRSVSEIFEYLGAILRYNDRERTFRFPINQDPTVADEKYGMTAEQRYVDGTAGTDMVVPADPPSAVLFAVNMDGTGHLSTNYNGQTFTVHDANLNRIDADYTKPILSMLSTLVDYSSQSGSVSTSTPVRLQPIP
jgi:hypothetical protein